ncbi:MAG: thiamine pyrophosphate-dependent enzyme [Candidatus Euphemobacter frigidus]|nr:thiamine pyrophosphate-dependent enzyme [Candidatus Euphemobacter frigidus]
MPLNLKELSKKPELLSPGHRACTGCGSVIAIRQALMAVEGPVVVSFATGCMEVGTTIYPYTSWRIPYIHNAFENAAATISGVETAYRALKKRGKIKGDIKFIAFGGDGGTYDIGLQSLSGALERGHDFLYICYNNEAYMNTGIQRSSATPFCASTTTSPAGDVIPGKTQFPKDLTGIVAAHHIPYAAQASPHNWRDYIGKVKKALAIKGPAFINVLASCFRGWRTQPVTSIDIVKTAVETCFWPLYEVENGEWKLNYKPKEKIPIEEWIKVQGRFKHLLKEENKPLLQEFQAWVDKQWADLLEKTGDTVQKVVV